jgi:Aerotolerance regulator N-terminal
MIGLLFANPGFLFIAAALISVPIIIHLINRMRFKRIRWAAMEFLLKAQKRTRRRLIIEQLLLLALRCLLIALVGLLVSRFVGCSDSNVAGKPNLHLVLLDDTLSMQDTWKHGDGTDKNCFDVAKSHVIIKEIAKRVSQSGSNDRVVILPLSKLNDEPKVYDHLNDKKTLDTLTQEITEMQPSFRHVSLLEGVKAAQQRMAQYNDSTITLHIISDLRHSDWGQPGGDGLNKQLLDIVAKNKDVKVFPIDTVLDPPRTDKQGTPQEHDNVGIVDFRPSTRIVAKKAPVKFTVKVRNFSTSKPMDVMLVARNEDTGKDLLDVNFTPSNPIRLMPDSTKEITFERGSIRTGDLVDLAKLKPGQPEFAHLSVRLTDVGMGPLAGDALQADNIRYCTVEVRDTVPILIVDGDGSRGREENKDSYMLARAAISAGRSYDVEFGDLLGPGGAAKALERGDLSKYPFIYLLNVPTLNEKQTTNLENYVKEGGGVAFFLGPLVNVKEFNKMLYKNGTGVFPAPLKEIVPPIGKDELPTKSGDTYQIITREDLFPNQDRMPIFGEMFEEPRQKWPLQGLPIHRYFKVDRAAWKPEKGRVVELATLPNDDPASTFNGQLASITREGQAFKNVRKTKEYEKFGRRFEELLARVEPLVQPGSEAKAYQLAAAIQRLLNDKGQKDVNPDMTVFWASSDPDIQTLREQLEKLREHVHYGDPFVITQTFGKGKVVAIMSTAGKDWNKWSGGSLAEATYPMFIVETQNYLSSPGDEGNLTVGTDLELMLDAEQFQGKQLKMVRKYIKARTGDQQKAEPDEKKQTSPLPDVGGGKIKFAMTKNNDPGLYISELFDDNGGDKPIARFAHVFNVDTTREGALQRVSSDDLDRNLVGKAPKDRIRVTGANAPGQLLVPKKDDFSESPWLFLILLLVLVAEQALAVHLSFHLKNTENELAPAKS